MEIIESFQAFKNLADRTFRGRSLGYQDEYEPEARVLLQHHEARMRICAIKFAAGRQHAGLPGAQVGPGVADAGVGGPRQVGVEADDRDLQHERGG